MQHYVNPFRICLDLTKVSQPLVERYKKILERDGQIVPIIVDDDGCFVKENYDTEMVLAARELGWPTVLIEAPISKEELPYIM